VLTVAGVSVAGLSTAASTALPRATEDRPDEVAGEQVHFLYVIPTDAPDEQLDVNGLLTSSIARMQAWLAGQTGGPKLRIDTYQGQPDITFVRTSVTPPDPYSEGFVVRGFVEQLGFANPKKVYVAYLGAYGAPTCGLADRGGKAGVLWLTCVLEWPTTAPFSLIDSVAMHETLHALGAVPDGAPNGYPDGHVRDPRDIMDRLPKQPDESGQVTVQLDPGRDDYYGHSMRLETDVADSRYLDSNPISGTPTMRVGSVARVKAPRGRLMVRARLSNVPAGRVTVQCSAKQGKRRLRVVARRYSASAAQCIFAGARRGLVSGKITVRSGQAVASRAFRVRA
jgi:hypothetical protein